MKSFKRSSLFVSTKTKKRESSSTMTSAQVKSKQKQNKGIKQFVNKGHLADEENEYYKEHFELISSCQKCRELQNQPKPKRRRKCTTHTIDLSKWTLWQTNCQKTRYFGHSNRTHAFCRLMESADRFRSDTIVEENEKKLVNHLQKSDLPGKSPKLKSGKSVTKMNGKDFRKNFLNKQIENNLSSDSDFDDVEKVDTVKTPLPKLADDEFKPCSLEKMIEKEERESTGKRSNRRIRITKLPKVPKIDLDVSDIKDNQLDFCSQVTMPTLFNRCQQKRKRESMKVLYEEELEEEDDDHNDDGSTPLEKKFKMADEETQNIENDVKQTNSDFSDVEVGHGKEPVTECMQDDNHKEDEDIIFSSTQAFLPMSTPQNKKPVVKSDSNVIPEAPLDIDLSSFLLESSITRETKDITKHVEEPVKSDAELSDGGDWLCDLKTKKEKEKVNENCKGNYKDAKETNFDLMGDSIMNLLDDDDGFFDDLPQSPTIVSQIKTVNNTIAAGDDILSSPPVISQKVIKTSTSTANNQLKSPLSSELALEDDSPVFVKPKSKSTKNRNCVIDSQPTPHAPALTSPMQVRLENNNDSTIIDDEFIAAPRNRNTKKRLQKQRLTVRVQITIVLHPMFFCFFLSLKKKF